jgi:putative acetyltransferase
MNLPMNSTSGFKDPDLMIAPYRQEFRSAFERLNREWIETWFEVEDEDREVFRNPEAKILAAGGQIFFVLRQGEVLGTCAVIPHGPGEWEIAKMAVASAARGQGLGDLLMEAAIDFAHSMQARRVIIVSNTALQPALRLYQKHGFLVVPMIDDGRYRRANIRLELELEATAPSGRPGAAGGSAAGPRHQ